jgi:hypothetical protein
MAPHGISLAVGVGMSLAAFASAQTDQACQASANAAFTACCGGPQMCALQAMGGAATVAGWCAATACTDALDTADTACHGTTGPAGQAYAGMRAVITCAPDDHCGERSKISSCSAQGGRNCTSMQLRAPCPPTHAVGA